MTDLENSSSDGTTRPTVHGAPSSLASPSEHTDQHTDFAHASHAWDASSGTVSAGPHLNQAENEAASEQDGKSNGTAAQPKRVREVLANAQEVVQRNYRVASDTADDFAHDNPWQSIAMAALGGLVIGMLISR